MSKTKNIITGEKNMNKNTYIVQNNSWSLFTNEYNTLFLISKKNGNIAMRPLTDRNTWNITIPKYILNKIEIERDNRFKSFGLKLYKNLYSETFYKTIGNKTLQVIVLDGSYRVELTDGYSVDVLGLKTSVKDTLRLINNSDVIDKLEL